MKLPKLLSFQVCHFSEAAPTTRGLKLGNDVLFLLTHDYFQKLPRLQGD